MALTLRLLKAVIGRGTIFVTSPSSFVRFGNYLPTSRGACSYFRRSIHYSGTDQGICISFYIDSNPDSFADSIKSNASATALELDADGRLEPYVSFEDFNGALDAMTDDERREFEKRLMPKMDCETIIEQPEGP